MIWKLEYYKDADDRREDKKSVDEFTSFEKAVENTLMRTGNHMGAVQLIHPELECKNKKATEKELAHTEVYCQEKYIGYFLPNNSKFAEVNENWNFVTKCGEAPNFHARTKKELLEKLLKILTRK